MHVPVKLGTHLYNVYTIETTGFNILPLILRLFDGPHCCGNYFPSAGSNGKDFMFLLKGHEDLRQDERVMQLFGLVNTLLNNDPETFKRHLR